MYVTGGGARGDDIRKARLHYELVGDRPQNAAVVINGMTATPCVVIYSIIASKS